eukprot:1192558-Prorocentrum_minimum.AAC.3
MTEFGTHDQRWSDRRRIPVVHLTQARPPLILCVKVRARCRRHMTKCGTHDQRWSDRRRIPVVHLTQARPPLILCVKVRARRRRHMTKGGLTGAVFPSCTSPRTEPRPSSASRCADNIYEGDLTGGEFEKNLASLKLEEGTDYIHFS